MNRPAAPATSPAKMDSIGNPGIGAGRGIIVLVPVVVTQLVETYVVFVETV